MQFHEERLVEIFDEVFPLLEKHHKEISLYADLELDPDWDTYEKLAATDMYQVYTVRDEGGLVGYAGFFVSPMMHFKHSLQAFNDLIYIRPEYRGNGVGKHFLSYLDSVFEKKNIKVVYYNVPAKNDWSIILRDKGYTLHDYMYSRRV